MTWSAPSGPGSCWSTRCRNCRPLRVCPCTVRVGVATGLVAASNPPGSNAAQTVNVVGDTPNLAMRLQTLAQPDTVVVSQATRSHLGRLFNYRDVNSVKLEGLPTETPVWQVMSENRSFGQFEALRSSTTPLVGRDEEMELLLRRWAQAKAGTGRVVLISAEPGWANRAGRGAGRTTCG